MNKKIIYLLIAVIIIILAVASVFIYKNSNKGQQNDIRNTNVNSNQEISKQEINENNKEKEDSKILIAVFSRAGENYSVGVVEKGNTEIMAENIAEITGGDLFKIEPVIPYPDGYEETKEISTREKDNNERPEIKNKVQNFDEYDTIFLGYPIWYGSYPMIINTFMESYDFTGKTVIPFNTHEGSGNAGTYTTIKNKLINSNVLEGLAIKGKDARENSSKQTITNWIKELNF